ncbi:4-hydroxy-3-methylbut-2-enyl diphosphate reductase [Haloglycomyces albus]|uniref:4-hydroxy-3-methylbut-2-enyl diphosphate reductase n=1 Tax=Haloglycomyces albus TaxID=526067 RepID=UPI0004A426DA|nr:4-hydroxy-3-methylbut-2-enyl diphosphate reductase [Haloglycomyces albus]
MVQPRTLLLASPRSFCAGVERAIAIVERLLEQHGPPIYVYNHIVHNLHIVEDLSQRGVVFVHDLTEVPSDARLVFSAHGVAPALHEEAKERRLDTVDATCPLVSKVHAGVHRALKDGRHVILIGHQGHDESNGVVGIDPEHITLVETVADVRRLDVPDRPLAYACQTTLSQTESADIIAELEARFPHIVPPSGDDICYATTNRQNALDAVVDEADVALILGSRYSSNTTRLWELAARNNTPAHLIADSSDIRDEWLDEGATVAITAGASSPPTLVDEVVEHLSELGPVQVEERVHARENVQFQLPLKVRS